MKSVIRERASGTRNSRRLQSDCESSGKGQLAPLALEPKSSAPEGWDWRRLSEIATLESGHTPSRRHPEWWGGDVPWISLTDIRKLDGKVALDTSEHTNALGLANSSARLLPAGTVCLSRTASVGYVTIMGREMATSQDFANWVCGRHVVPEFLALLLRASREFIVSLGTGATHKTIYMPTIKEFHVCVPSVAEQKRLASKLQKQLELAVHLKAQAEQQLKEIDTLPARLLASAFA